MPVPTPTREVVLNALYALIDCGTQVSPGPGIAMGFKSSWRRLPPYEVLIAERQPAIIQTLYAEHIQHVGRGLPYKRHYAVQWTIFAMCANQEDTGDGVLNPLLDQILYTALAPDTAPPDGEPICTLGGLVNRVWIEGTIGRDPGDLTGQVACTVPINILVP